MIITKQYDKIEINEREILRYSGASYSDESVISMMRECLGEATALVKPMLCFTEIGKTELDSFRSFCDEGAAFNDYVSGINHAILFAASIGHAFDRLIAKYERLSVVKAQVMHAIGAQQIEGLCDIFCDEIAKEFVHVKPRFSPGYGGLKLESQKYVFELLDCYRKIGLCLNDSLLMSPSKSVTAIIALTDE